MSPFRIVSVVMSCCAVVAIGRGEGWWALGLLGGAVLMIWFANVDDNPGG